MLLKLKANVIWKVSTMHSFNAVAFGRLFKQNMDSIVTVGEDGMVWVYEVPTTDGHIQPIRNLETKCGPLSHILLHDVTRLSPNDMLVSDTRGTIVLFCDGQILVRRCSISGKTARVTALEVEESKLGHVRVVIGSSDGDVTSFNTFSQLWKIRLKDHPHQALKDHPHKNLKKSVSCILAAHVVMSTGASGDFILVADTSGCVHVLDQGKIISSTSRNVVVTSMVAGRFVLDDRDDQAPSPSQIALGCDDGSVWVMADFMIDTTSPYVHLGHPISHLCRISTRNDYVNPASPRSADILVCCGHFSSVQLLQHGKIIYTLPLTGWPVSVCPLTDVMEIPRNNADVNLILIGCHDSTLQLVSVT